MSQNTSQTEGQPTGQVTQSTPPEPDSEFTEVGGKVFKDGKYVPLNDRPALELGHSETAREIARAFRTRDGVEEAAVSDGHVTVFASQWTAPELRAVILREAEVEVEFKGHVDNDYVGLTPQTADDVFEFTIQ